MIRQLKAQGMTLSAIARELGLNRRTVRRALQEQEPPEYGPRQPRPSVLDPFKPYIDARLKEFDLSAVRLLDEIRQKGYEGGYTTVKEFVSHAKQKSVVKAVVRFETQPGGQGQVDWADFGTVTLDGVEHKLRMFGMVLGYSRMRYVEFVLDASTPSLIQCHLNAFAYFGGYPREILYDNMKQVVLERRERPDQIKWTPLFADFAKHHEFLPRLCRPYRAQTKGKVERLVGYVRSNFFEGREFTSLQDLNQQARAWLDLVNKKEHGTTGIPPVERLVEEQLIQLAGRPAYVVTQTTARKVDRESFVSYLGNRYSVPWKHAQREVTLRVRQGKLDIEVGGEVVATHDVHPGERQVVRVKEHFTGLLRMTRERAPQARRALEWASSPKVEYRTLREYDELVLGA